MTRDELIAWCGHFWIPKERRSGCEAWNAGVSCAVLAAGNSAFVPEPIRGNPLNKDIIFLAVNPGGGKTPAAQDELDSCPWWDRSGNKPGGDWATVLGSQEDFAGFHLGSNERAASDETERHIGYARDRVSTGAAYILAAVGNPQENSIPIRLHIDSMWFSKYIGDVALLNMAHCKSPGWTVDKSKAVADLCAPKTMALLHDLKPRALVCLGVPAWELLVQLAKSCCCLTESSTERLWHLRWHGGGVTGLVKSPHPTILSYADRADVVDAIKAALSLRTSGSSQTTVTP